MYEGLRVRSLCNFNVAMLAKQGWRILNESNPLVTAIMKAKYFPSTDFQNAQLGTSPSYVWRSIMCAQETVKKGARRKIGDGLNTKVWNVQWLPGLENGCLTIPMPVHLQDIVVQNLMCLEKREWDIEVLCDICNERDVELLKRVPVPMNERMDSWFWLLEDSGKFTVRSCYRVL